MNAPGEEYEHYESLPPELREPASHAETGDWHVLVEYDGQLESKPISVVQVVDGPFAGEQAAQAAAERTALTFDPPDPWTPRSRSTFRVRDGYLTLLEGQVHTFRFLTRVGQQVIGGPDDDEDAWYPGKLTQQPPRADGAVL